MNYQQPLQQNIWKLYVMRVIRGFSLLVPVISLFFIDRGLTLSEIFALQALFGLTYLALELPSGYFADRYGRKLSLVLGALFWLLGDASFIFAYGFWELFRAEFLLGVAASLISGADEAMMHDTLRDLKKKGRYMHHDKNMFSLYVIAEAVGGLTGGALIIFLSFSELWMVQTGISLLALPLALSLTEPKAHESRPLESIMSEIKNIVRLPGMPGFLLLYASTFTTTLMMMWFAQPFMVELGLAPACLGVVWAGFLTLSVLGAQIATLLTKWYRPRAIIGVLVCSPLLLYGLLAVLPNTIWLIGIVALFWIQRGVQNPILRTALQRRIEETNRATALSLAGASARAVFLLSPILGSVAIWGSYGTAFLVTGITLSALGATGMIWWRIAERN